MDCLKCLQHAQTFTTHPTCKRQLTFLLTRITAHHPPDLTSCKFASYHYSLRGLGTFSSISRKDCRSLPSSSIFIHLHPVSSSFSATSAIICHICHFSCQTWQTYCRWRLRPTWMTWTFHSYASHVQEQLLHWRSLRIADDCGWLRMIADACLIISKTNKYGAALTPRPKRVEDCKRHVR